MIARDCHGVFLWAKSDCWLGADPPFRAELKPLLFTVREVAVRQCFGVIIEGDCKLVIDWILDRSPSPSPDEVWKEEIQRLCLEGHLSIQWVPRLCNVPADTIAGAALRGGGFGFEVSCPPFLVDVCNRDWSQSPPSDLSTSCDKLKHLCIDDR